MKYYDEKLGNYKKVTPSNSSNKVVLRSLKPWRTDVYFNHQTKKYELMGIKYCDLNFKRGSGEYKITDEKYNDEKYNSIKKKEGVSEHSEFKFTLFRNDLLLIKDSENNEQEIFRFVSRTGSAKHYVELKPYDKARFEENEYLMSVLGKATKGGRCLKGLNKPNISIYKVKTDVLGNKHFIKKEGDESKLNFKK